MFSKLSLAHYSPGAVAIWFSMAFQAGAINAGGFLSCHRFVSHTTGFATHFGSEFAMGHVRASLGILSVPIFFLLGSMISAFFIARNSDAGKNPHYTTVVFLIALILFGVSLGGQLDYFGSFGEPVELSQDYYLLALLSLASGLQNATVTSASGAVIRTTHLTGLTTDLGIGLVRFFSTASSSQAKRHELKANFSRIGIIGSFILGSTLSAYLFLEYGYLGFLLPASISTILLIIGLRVKILAQRSSRTS